MTNFGSWLGKSNGKEMLYEVANYGMGCSQKYIASAITTYCILFGIEEDTEEWYELLKDICKYWNGETYEHFVEYVRNFMK